VVIIFEEVATGIQYFGTYFADTGKYAINIIEFGAYKVQCTSSTTIIFTTTVTLIENITDLTINNPDHHLLLSTILDALTWRAVLTWGQVPADLDTHVYYPGSTEVVKFHHRIGDDGKVKLDVDDRDGHGPETTTIIEELTGGAVYRYVVYNYSQTPDFGFDVCKPRVMVYKGNTVQQEIVYAINGTGYYWHVFTLGGGVLTVQNVTQENDLEVGATGGFTLQNIVHDAATGGALISLTGVSITFTHATTGRVLTGMYNKDTAQYTVVGLTVGDYHVHFSSDQTIALNVNNFAHIIGDSFNISSHIFNISKTLATETYRAILTWNTKPWDLDSNTYYTPAGGSEVKIFYNMRNSADGKIKLDLDDTNGEGPETTTMDAENIGTGKIRFVVFNYSQDKALSASGANVQLLKYTSEVANYNVPTTGTGVFWHVFTITSTGHALDNVINNSDLPL